MSPQCAQSQRPALCAPQQECPADKANNIRQPRPRGGRDLSMPSQRNPNECDRVVSEHQQDSQHKSARLAALLRGESQWNSYQRQDQAGIPLGLSSKKSGKSGGFVLTILLV